MGMPRSEAYAMSWWEFCAAKAYWNKHHADPKGGSRLTDAEVIDLADWMDKIERG